MQFVAPTRATRCYHFTGTVTLVSPAPSFDVKFNLTCSDGGYANGLKVAGELTSSL
jgi:hypothetical protein